jgi:hypothetical protein
MPLQWAIENLDWRNLKSVSPRVLEYFENGDAHFRKLRNLIALHTKNGPQGAFMNNPHRYWWDVALADLPRELHDKARRADEKMLDVAAAVGELNATGETPTAATVAKRLDISRAKFYRLGLAADLKRFLRALNTGEPTVEKDSRARKLYADNLSR